MILTTVKLEKEQRDNADKVAALLTQQFGVKFTRSDVIRIALGHLIDEALSTDETTAQEDHENVS